MDSPRKQLVGLFYAEVWDKHDKSKIPSILHDDFAFRASLGPVRRGHAGFIAYLDWLLSILSKYRSDIHSLTEEGDVIAARLTFSGDHTGAELFGFAPTGKRISWNGAAFFTFRGERVADLWVLGDVHGIIEQLNETSKTDSSQ